MAKLRAFKSSESNIQGNTVTRDKVIRLEFRLNEGDAFNAYKVKRSQDRIQSLGFFQENLEIKQTQGSSNDRVVLNVDVEEKSTGQLELSAGYSSLERFILSTSITQRNFMGKGQQLQTGVSYSKYGKSISAGFTEPFMFVFLLVVNRLWIFLFLDELKYFFAALQVF